MNEIVSGIISKLLGISDNAKVTISSLIIAFLAVIYLKVFMIDEIKAHSIPIQESVNFRFAMIMQSNENQFKLLRDDIRVVKSQNLEILRTTKKNKGDL